MIVISTSNETKPVQKRTITLTEQEIINVENTDTILLVKLKDIDSMENMYVICRNEGFLDLNIHHVGGYWIWIQFPSSMSCSKFQENESLKRLYSIKRAPMPNFKIDERILWIEVSGLPLCAWGSMAYKKIASSFGKFLFFEKEESTALSSGRLCISTKSHIKSSRKTGFKVGHQRMSLLRFRSKKLDHGVQNKDDYNVLVDLSMVVVLLLLMNKEGTKL
ncbi:hypothetical protein Tco_0134232 [Tanacetum coccineum]